MVELDGGQDERPRRVVEELRSLVGVRRRVLVALRRRRRARCRAPPAPRSSRARRRRGNPGRGRRTRAARRGARSSSSCRACPHDDRVPAGEDLVVERLGHRAHGEVRGAAPRGARGCLRGRGCPPRRPSRRAPTFSRRPGGQDLDAERGERGRTSAGRAGRRSRVTRCPAGQEKAGQGRHRGPPDGDQMERARGGRTPGAQFARGPWRRQRRLVGVSPWSSSRHPPRILRRGTNQRFPRDLGAAGPVPEGGSRPSISPPPFPGLVRSARAAAALAPRWRPPPALAAPGEGGRSDGPKLVVVEGEEGRRAGRRRASPSSRSSSSRTRASRPAHHGREALLRLHGPRVRQGHQAGRRGEGHPQRSTRRASRGRSRRRRSSITDDPAMPQKTLFLSAVVKPFVDALPYRLLPDPGALRRGRARGRDPRLGRAGLQADEGRGAELLPACPLAPVPEKELVKDKGPNQWKVTVTTDPDAPEGLLGGAVKVDDGRQEAARDRARDLRLHQAGGLRDAALGQLRELRPEGRPGRSGTSCS